MAKTVKSSSEQMEAEIAEVRIRDPELREAFIDLIRTGSIINSGRRRKGEIVWIAADDIWEGKWVASRDANGDIMWVPAKLSAGADGRISQS